MEDRRGDVRGNLAKERVDRARKMVRRESPLSPPFTTRTRYSRNRDFLLRFTYPSIFFRFLF